MKKKYLILIALLFIFTGVAHAEKCTVVTGNKIDIGSEIACGNEHFYIIDNDGEDVKMLSKYNLYVGANYSKINLDMSKTYIKMSCKNPKIAAPTCSPYNTNSKFYFEGEEVAGLDEWKSKIKEKYDLDHLFEENSAYYYEMNYDGKKAFYLPVYGDTYTEDELTYKNMTYKLYPYEFVRPGSNGYALQNELAKGVTGDKGNATYPIYGTTILFNEGDDLGDNGAIVNSFDTFAPGYTNFEFSSGDLVRNYLDDYKTNLNNDGYKIQSTNLLSVKELDDLVYAVSDERLPLIEWYNASLTTDPNSEDGTNYQSIGDLKEILPKDYFWLWNTTYWMRTLTLTKEEFIDQDVYHPLNAYFVSSAGDICYAQGDCYSGIPRAGIRPVVTLAVSEINFRIETKTDGNGEVKAEKINASSGEVIKFTITPNEGYVLGEVKVTDANGNVVIFKDYTFTMPDANVLIEAKFVPENPNTKAFISYIIIVIGGIAGMSFYLLSQRKKLIK